MSPPAPAGDSNPPLPPALQATLRVLVRQLRQAARRANHRLTLVLAGDADWTITAAACVLEVPAGSHAGAAGHAVACLSDRSLASPRLPLGAGQQLLGTEIDTLVYDAHGGFDPDGFGAAVGALRGGGLLLLLTPPFASWPEMTDPQAARIAVHPFTADQVPGRYLRRLVRVIVDAPGVTLVRQGQAVPVPDLKLGDTTEGTSAEQVSTVDQRQRQPGPEPVQLGITQEWRANDCRTPDQAEAVAAIVHTARRRAHRPLVITSDRGRGKSSALGIAAARLLADGERRILVTGPRHTAIEPVFRHASRLLPDAEVHSDRIVYRGGWLARQPPDALCLEPHPADLLLVDEAAGIPAPLLERLLRVYPRVVFATTVHGYEGSGRGFEVRFGRTLDEMTPQWRGIELKTPVRWAADDPLEALVSHALLLDAAPAPEEGLARAVPAHCEHRLLTRDSLSADEPSLREVFGLLVLAHYQTRPFDLRHLLDGPNIEVHALRHGQHVAATALVAREGDLEAELARQVFNGERRPRGHLLPQTLSVHAGLEEAARLRFARIVRIAVHPAARGRGLGRALVERIIAAAEADGRDLVGASFGATTGLLRFWTRCGLAPAHIGTSRNAASGAYAAVVLRGLSPAGGALLELARTRLGSRFPTLLAGPLRDLEPDIAAALLAAAPSASLAARPAIEQRELTAFAFARHPYEATLPLIDALVRARFATALREDALDTSQQIALITKVLQHRSWTDTARLIGARGRAEVIALLRTAVARLIAR